MLRPSVEVPLYRSGRVATPRRPWVPESDPMLLLVQPRRVPLASAGETLAWGGHALVLRSKNSPAREVTIR